MCFWEKMHRAADKYAQHLDWSDDSLERSDQPASRYSSFLGEASCPKALPSKPVAARRPEAPAPACVRPQVQRAVGSSLPTKNQSRSAVNLRQEPSLNEARSLLSKLVIQPTTEVSISQPAAEISIDNGVQEWDGPSSTHHRQVRQMLAKGASVNKAPSASKLHQESLSAASTRMGSQASSASSSRLPSKELASFAVPARRGYA